MSYLILVSSTSTDCYQRTFLVADTAAGCELIARFFCLDENHQIIGPLLQGTILQESEEGRELYNLYKYENDAATRMAREAIITLEKTLEPYIKITAVRISRLTELINSFCSYLNTVFEVRLLSIKSLRSTVT